MKFATLQEEDDYLFTQYVLTLENDDEWYKAVSPHLAAEFYERFALASYPYITKLMRELEDTSVASEPDSIQFLMRRVALGLWHQTVDASANLNEPYYVRHVKSVQEYVKSRTQMPSPKLTDDGWINYGVEPTEDGVYEIENPQTPYRRYSMWKGSKWRAFVDSIEKATTVEALSISIHNEKLRWRPIQGSVIFTPTLVSNLEERTDIMPIDNTKPFVSATYVYGQDTSDMTEAQLLGAIKKIEKEIADLKSIGVKSTKIASNIETLEKALAEVVAALDAK